MEVGIVAYLILTGVFLFGVYVLIFLLPLGLWLKARISGVQITLLDLINMKVCRVPPSTVVKAMIMAAKSGIEINYDALESHCRAGGNVENVLRLMILAKEKNKKLSFEEACQRDLAGKNLKKDVSKKL